MRNIGPKAIEFLTVACNLPNNHPCYVAQLYGKQRRGRHVVVALISNGLLRHKGGGYYEATKQGRAMIKQITRR